MDRDKKLLFLNISPETSDYTSTSSGGAGFTYPPRNRAHHAALIAQKLEQAWEQSRRERDARTAVAIPTRHGMYLEFESQPGFSLKTERLENRHGGIRLMNVRTDTRLKRFDDNLPESVMKATVFIPEGQENFFLKKVRQYANQDTKTPGRPKNNELISSIEDIHLALVEALWTDERGLFPGDDPCVCEVWLHGDDPEVESIFRTIADTLQIRVQAGSLHFPERTVVLANVNRSQLVDLFAACDSLAEFRRAKTTAAFWTDLGNADQVDWARDLRDRLELAPDPHVAVSILDTGVNNGHMLLEPVLHDEDCHACDPEWGVHDHRGHGTLMAGLAGYGNLEHALADSAPVTLLHRLESVKILSPSSDNPPDLYGYLTSQGVSRVEITAPRLTHIHCLAVTSEDGRDRGRPTSWSAALDALAAGQAIGKLAPEALPVEVEDEIGDEKRLIIVSAGNVEGQSEWNNYPESNLRCAVHDPAQSWNALTVGAFTEKCLVENPDYAGYAPVAPAGGLSPFSSTSVDWDSKWPFKPDILLEGGNVVRDASGFCSSCEDTDVLSTSHTPAVRQFDTVNATSAATAHAAWMAAQIQALYPQAWPETVRGLMVHSANWTQQMERNFLPSKTKKDFAHLLRVCGYGVPDLPRALYCASNRLTLIVQNTLQPFDKKEDRPGFRTKDMHLYELPWPRDVLESLGETELTMRVTLSYFIEPSPGEVGWKNRYRYQSHGLRFDLNAPLENRRQFLVRLNRAARDEGEQRETSSDGEKWRIGSQGRVRGSMHSDIWKGQAAELASCNLVGVYPVIGWWRERPWLNCWSKQTRYSLIVSIHAPEVDVDIYTPVAIQTAVQVPVW